VNKTLAYDVFLSHNSADKPQVRQLAEQLRDAGITDRFENDTDTQVNNVHC
jgi:molybdate-binding protein